MTFTVLLLFALFATACLVVYKIITSPELDSEEVEFVADDFLYRTGGWTRDERVVRTGGAGELGLVGLSTDIHSR